MVSRLRSAVWRKVAAYMALPSSPDKKSRPFRERVRDCGVRINKSDL